MKLHSYLPVGSMELGAVKKLIHQWAGDRVPERERDNSARNGHISADRLRISVYDGCLCKRCEKALPSQVQPSLQTLLSWKFQQPLSDERKLSGWNLNPGIGQESFGCWNSLWTRKFRATLKQPNRRSFGKQIKIKNL